MKAIKHLKTVVHNKVIFNELEGSARASVKAFFVPHRA